MKKTHVSFSEVKTWDECTWKHKLDYIDKIKVFKGNEYTAFGKAIHTVGEVLVFDEEQDAQGIFENQFLSELKMLKDEDNAISFDTKLVNDMRSQGLQLAPQLIPGLGEHFENYEVCATEEALMVPIDGVDYNFKGFIDLVIKKDDQYHILDWKTCSWGWNAKKKTDRMLSYQLTLYKHFYAKKHGIDPSKIKTYFALLKRTAKKNQVEIFEVKAGPKKIENALKLIKKMLYNVERQKFIKNKLSCTYCPYDGTKHCIK